MSVRNGLFTSESVSAGHPDKLCDRISDAVLDAFLRRDRHARVACETFAADQKIIVAGEFKTTTEDDFCEIEAQTPSIVREVLASVGYGHQEYDIDPSSCVIEVRFNRQSPEIQSGVDGGQTLGAGDQGLMFGYASAETEALTPLAWTLATDLVEAASGFVGRAANGLKPDGKAQVTLRYRENRPVGVEAVVLSWQHGPDRRIEDVRDFLLAEIIDKVVPRDQRTPSFKAYVNPAGSFTIGGPKGDTGLTGRKIIVDTYGGACPHGGGAFSGKDPSKVDRSGAYAARHVAKNIVGAGLANRCTVQLAYAIGVAEPVSISVDTHGTGVVSEDKLAEKVRQIWGLTPAGIICDLELLRPIYTPTTSLGHFGRWRPPETYIWERLNQVSALRSAFT